MPRPTPHNRITIKERRENILMLLTKGMKGYQIAKELGVDASTSDRLSTCICTSKCIAPLITVTDLD